MDEIFYVKSPVILVVFIVLFTILAISLIRKIYLWLKVDRRKRVKLIKSFFIFFTIHDLHDSSTEASRKFKQANNWCNAFFWGSIIGIAFTMVFNTNDKGKIFKSKVEQYWENR